MIIGQTVIIIDLGNYNSNYAEDIPFKGIITEITDYPCYQVRSLITGKEYELYESQILEGLSIEEIGNLLNMSKYGL